MKIKEIREKTDAELRMMLGELQKESYQLRIQAKIGQLQKTSRPAAVRRDIARIMTEQTARSVKGA